MTRLRGAEPRRIAALATLVACSLIAFVAESLCPVGAIPGARLGLGNVFVLIAILVLGNAEGVFLVVAKTLLGALIAGNPGAAAYGLAGGLCSVAFCVVMLNSDKCRCSLVGISVCSAVINNIAQNATFCAAMQSPVMFAWLPYLVLTGCVGGATVGATATLALKRLPARMLALGRGVEEDRVGTEKR